jgi:hypothetical protein
MKFTSIASSGLVQYTTISNTDGKTWKAVKGADQYVFYKTDSSEIGVIKNNQVQTPSSAITNFETLCIDKEVNYVYVLTSDSNLYVYTIATNTLSSSTSLGVTVTPSKALINYNGDKIIWLGDNNTLYKMDLDGSNIESTALSGSNSNAKSFCLTSSGIAYSIRNIYLYKIPIDTMILERIYILEFATTFFSSAECRNMFIYNDKIYACAFRSSATTTGRLFEFEQTDPNTNKTNVDLNSLYSIDYGDIEKFYPINSNGTIEGRLLENNGTDRKILYKVDLSTLALTPLRYITSPSGSPITASIEFSNDTGYDVVIVDGSGNNDQPSGTENDIAFGNL